MDSEQIKRLTCQDIQHWDPHQGFTRWDDEVFSERAVRLFTYQFEYNKAYRAYCQRKGVEPKNISHYRQIPEVPTDVFKVVSLSTTPQPAVHFKTSGTTQGQQGIHWMEDTDVYKTSVFDPFRRYGLCEPKSSQASIVLLHPHRDDLPHSSLSFMLTAFEEHLFDQHPVTYAVQLDGEEWTWAFDAFSSHLDEAQRQGRPVCILGTAFGWMTILDHVTGSWTLPPGSMVMETGGFKGRSREVSKMALYEMFRERLGVPKTHCISEYSMTELSAQAYSNNLWAWSKAGDVLDLNQRRFETPPWARVEVVDPQTMQTLPPHTRGLLRWYDLSNIWSVSTVQTSDVGIVDEHGGFEVIGRAEGAQLRGCSMSIEEMKLAVR